MSRSKNKSIFSSFFLLFFFPMQKGANSTISIVRSETVHNRSRCKEAKRTHTPSISSKLGLGLDRQVHRLVPDHQRLLLARSAAYEGAELLPEAGLLLWRRFRGSCASGVWRNHSVALRISHVSGSSDLALRDWSALTINTSSLSYACAQNNLIAGENDIR